MNLTQLIVDAQAELKAETPIRLTVRFAPKLLDADGVQTHYPDEGGIGPPLSPEMHRLLALQERFSPEFLMRESLLEVNDYCRAKHPEHDFEERAKPLCGQLVYAVIIGNQSPIQIARNHNLRPEVVNGLLLAALRYADAWRMEQRARAGFVENQQAETVAERLRREHDLVHEERAWRLTKQKYRLPAWEVELAQRRAEHKRLGCASCPLAVAA